MKIGRYEIGPSVFFIAEIGSNHNGDFSLAKELVVAAARSGASAVKFQTYRAEKLVRPDVPALAHVRAQYKTQLERFRSLEFAPAQWRELAELARQAGLSPSRLSRLFRAQTGVSLVEYRNQQRLERFLRLYRQGRRWSMLAAALTAGFGSYPQFHRVFKRLMGSGPAEYRRKVSQAGNT